jgi:ketosteroid isomerase-like protein
MPGWMPPSPSFRCPPAFACPTALPAPTATATAGVVGARAGGHGETVRRAVNLSAGAGLGDVAGPGRCTAESRRRGERVDGAFVGDAVAGFRRVTNAHGSSADGHALRVRRTVNRIAGAGLLLITDTGRATTDRGRNREAIVRTQCRGAVAGLRQITGADTRATHARGVAGSVCATARAVALVDGAGVGVVGAGLTGRRQAGVIRLVAGVATDAALVCDLFRAFREADLAAILGFLMNVTGLTQGSFHLDFEDVLANERFAVAPFRGHARRGDKVLDNPTCLRLRIEDGQVVELKEFVWDLVAVDEFWA